MSTVVAPGRTRVLIVDDSALTRSLIVHHLADAGHELHQASGGEQALELLARERYDVILLDIEMPGMDGHALMRRLRSHPAHHDVPVVFVTGRSDPVDVAEGLRLGAHDYLRKPFEPVELVARVHTAMRFRALQQALHERNAQLELLASTDVLTGLYNRRVVEDQGARLISRARRHGGCIGTVLLDLDFFKEINDTRGHLAGDAVLVEVASRLQKGLRNEDVLGRWGGEEFIVVAGDTSAEGIATLAERLRVAVSDGAIDTSDGSVPVTASVGWASATGGTAFNALVREADRALYAAKAAGRNAVRGTALTA